MYEELKKTVFEANMQVYRQKLAICNWGNVSGIDRQSGVIAIKPSGINYEDLTSEKIVVLDLHGKVLDGGLRPSSDTATHLELYRNFASIGGICHTHSPFATAWSQACREIPCLGTTHADYFYGPVPVTEEMTDSEISSDYELNTAKVIVRRFKNIDPLQMPAVLVGSHGPFTWGENPAKAVEAAIVLEQVSFMALQTLTINSERCEILHALKDKHYMRKHGRGAYYGQNKG